MRKEYEKLLEVEFVDILWIIESNSDNLVELIIYCKDELDDPIVIPIYKREFREASKFFRRLAKVFEKKILLERINREFEKTYCENKDDYWDIDSMNNQDEK